jgi:isoleucyl-tRNA synthetase
MAFCLEAEKFVDDKLSNWYVRRNRRRFWKSEKGEDKLAAYQTLYTVLTTLTKLFAPIMPFLTEAMYQNLIASKQGVDVPHSPESAHHCDFPNADQTLIDDTLSADMNALLRLVSLGSAARNSVKMKVRQPLAEMKVDGGVSVRRAVERFADQICEELNLKRVTLVPDSAQGSLTQPVMKPNLKVLGPKYGSRLQEVIAAIEAAYASTGKKSLPNQLDCPGGPIKIEAEDITIDRKPPTGWAVAFDGDTEVIIDARLTDELKQEGMAREVVRHVQQARKDAGLEMEDRIVLRLDTEVASLAQAIETHQTYICSETLATRLTTEPLDGEIHRAEVKIDGQTLCIELRKAT